MPAVFAGGIRAGEKRGQKEMRYGRLQKSMTAVLLACLAMLLLSTRSMAYKSGSGTSADPYISEITSNEECDLGASPDAATRKNYPNAKFTFAWGRYDKTTQKPDLDSELIQGAAGSSFQVKNLTNSNLVYFCRIYADGTWLGTVFFGFEILPDKADASEGSQTDKTAVSPAKLPKTVAKVSKDTRTKAAKSKVTISWKKVKDTKKTKKTLGKIRYVQVQCCLDRKFTKTVISKKVKKSKTKAVFSLTRKKTWYFRIRYIGTKGVSHWSKVGKIKVK